MTDKVYTEVKLALDNIIHDDILNYVIKDYINYNKYDIKRQSLISTVLINVGFGDGLGYTKEAYEIIFSLLKCYIDKLLISNLSTIIKETKETNCIDINVLSFLIKTKCFPSDIDNNLKRCACKELLKGINKFYNFSVQNEDMSQFDDLLPNSISFTSEAKYGLRCVIEYILAEVLELSSNFCKNELNDIMNHLYSEEENESDIDEYDYKARIKKQNVKKNILNLISMSDSFELIINYIYEYPEIVNLIKKDEQVFAEVKDHKKYFEIRALKRVCEEKQLKIKLEKERSLKEERRQRQKDFCNKYKEIVSEMIPLNSENELEIEDGEYYGIITAFHIEYIIKNDKELYELFYN